MKEKLTIMSDRLGLTEIKMAEYLGVPLPTYRKWVKGERNPNSSAVRLIELLELIEVFCPQLIDVLKRGK